MTKFVSTAKLSKAGADFIRQHEGVRLKAYKPVEGEKGGHYTIGYGHYGSDVTKDMRITLSEAERMFDNDIQKYVVAVNKALQVVTNQNQFDALVSLCYNIGISAFTNSTLVKKINKGDYIGASKEFARWNKVNKKVITGLVRRRADEYKLFLKPRS